MILLALIAWNLWILWPSEQGIASIPYSFFLDQVRANNVTAIKIAGDAISGEFVRPVAWPTTTTTPTTPPTVPTTVEPVMTYQSFQTTFPKVVGDAALMPLLQAHAVTVPPPAPARCILINQGL